MADDLEKELDMWMEHFTAEHSLEEVTRVVVEERIFAVSRYRCPMVLGITRTDA